ncbi:DUF6461 domain-containing protein [Kitasatospora sp. NPDC057223]|uniref:DUF6461 domain-containing protein n=1 Tax=Kitasatospora sp. NPDC057223 TaxID=3346055 RepID=UPI00362905A9
MPSVRSAVAPAAAREDAQTRQLEEDIVMWRAGVYGGWAFAIQAWGSGVLTDDVLKAVSAGTRAVTLTSTATIPWFNHYDQSEQICSFDPSMPWLRHGASPEHLNTAILQAGLGPEPHTRRPDYVAGMLLLGENAFGLDLPYDAVVQGELLGAVIPG